MEQVLKLDTGIENSLVKSVDIQSRIRDAAYNGVIDSLKLQLQHSLDMVLADNVTADDLRQISTDLRKVSKYVSDGLRAVDNFEELTK